MHKRIIIPVLCTKKPNSAWLFSKIISSASKPKILTLTILRFWGLTCLFDDLGLDDDGSGLMVLYEILRVIIETGYKPEKNVQLHAYASEELGLLGSDQIANDYKSEGKYVFVFRVLQYHENLPYKNYRH